MGMRDVLAQTAATLPAVWFFVALAAFFVGIWPSGRPLTWVGIMASFLLTGAWPMLSFRTGFCLGVLSIMCRQDNGRRSLVDWAGYLGWCGRAPPCCSLCWLPPPGRQRLTCSGQYNEMITIAVRLNLDPVHQTGIIYAKSVPSVHLDSWARSFLCGTSVRCVFGHRGCHAGANSRVTMNTASSNEETHLRQARVTANVSKYASDC